MAWSAGLFSRTNGVNVGTDAWAQDKAAGVKIVTSRHDAHDQDLAAGINNCLTKDGQNEATANIPLGGFKITGLDVGTASGQAMLFNQFAFTSFTPVISVVGPMTYTSVTVTFGKRVQLGKLVLFAASFTGTVGGTPGAIITMSLGVTAVNQGISAAVQVTNGGAIVGGSSTTASTTTIDLRLSTAAVYTAGTVAVTVYGFYEAA